MTNKITHINTRRYWKITSKGETFFEGTFVECWEKLVSEFGNLTLASIAAADVRIERNKAQ